MQALECGHCFLLRFPVAGGAFGLRQAIPRHFIVGIQFGCAFERRDGLLGLLAVETNATQADQRLFEIGETLDHLFELRARLVQIPLFLRDDASLPIAG